MMNIRIDIMILVVSAFAVIGCIQWLKQLAPKVVSGWRVPVASLLLSFAVAVAVGGGWNQIAVNALVMLALVEMAWSLIVKTVLNLVGKIGGAAPQQLDGSVSDVEKSLMKMLPSDPAPGPNAG